MAAGIQQQFIRRAGRILTDSCQGGNNSSWENMMKRVGVEWGGQMNTNGGSGATGEGRRASFFSGDDVKGGLH